MIPISVTILTRDSELYLRQVLDALSEFQEVLILDNGSHDQTLMIAATYKNVKIEKAKFCGFGAMKNLAASLASLDWVLTIDSDEIISPELLSSIRNLRLSQNEVYLVDRLNHFSGKPVWHSGWYPDFLPRLYHRKMTAYNEARVHETLQLKNLKPVHLRGKLLHYTYASNSQLLRKMEHYSTLYAEQNSHKNIRAWELLPRFVFRFLRCYILKRGFLDGYHGILIAFYEAATVFFKYAKIIEINGQHLK